MVSARCQWVRSARIVGKPIPTGVRAAHCFSVGCRLACDGIGAVSVGTQRPHRWQANSHRGPRSTLLFCGMQPCLRWYRRGVSEHAAPASLASQLPPQHTAFLWDAGLPAMVSARCQWVRSARIVGKPTPTGDRAVHCFSVGCRLACDGIGAVSVGTQRLHRWQANSHRGPRQNVLGLKNKPPLKSGGSSVRWRQLTVVGRRS